MRQPDPTDPPKPIRAPGRIADVCSLIEADLTRVWTTAHLAREAGMAQHHFQRQFAAATGETVAGYIRSRRLEKAAIALASSQARVIDIALDCGFQTHAALTRAFTAHFGLAPQTFRQQGLPVHRQGLMPRPYLRPITSRSLAIGADLVQMPSQWLCWRRSRGMSGGRFFPDLQATARAFAELAQEVPDPVLPLATGYPRGPAAFHDPEAEAFFGALFPQRRALIWPEGWTEISAGLYAVFPHYGPLTTLHLSWNRSVRAGFDQLDVTFRSAWMFETYLTPRVDAAPDALSALIHVPVEKSTLGKAPQAG
ncbi:helix-turn-helix domain-containing protein [Gymnodinialimonas sp. 2305UL16-5]|uniref:helix-turn-helix domain-containing protein n=1 Tax=Gymnodinialimonas mytili TaxID=3126503 RepID=UPI00309A1D5C